MDLLPVLCAALVGTALLVYALLAGFDLGVGLLTLIAPRDRDRAAMLASLAPVWYGSALWLALAAVALAALSPAGAILLGALWPWLAVMALALTARAAAYALRGRAGALGRGAGRACETAFGLASGLAILCQGCALGAGLSGVPETGRLLGWDLVLGLICAAGLVGAYALLGAGWLAWRGAGAARVFGREVGHAAVILTVGSVALACAWAALTGAPVAARWTAWPGMALPPILLAAVLGLGAWTWRGLWSGPPGAPLARGAIVMLAVSAGLAASVWPAVAPGSDLPGAARGPLALRFTLFDAGLAAPVLLAYLVHAIRLLRAPPEPETAALPAGPTHAGRRTATLHGNDLHLS